MRHISEIIPEAIAHIPKIELYNQDCLTALKETPDKYYDLALVDPPYGIGVNHNMGRRKGDKPSGYKPAIWDNEPPPHEYFEELFRVSKNQVVWGANHFISRMPFDSSCWLMWDKKFSEDVSFAQYEMAWTSFKSVCKKIEIHPSQNDRIHPTQKPVKLYKWVLKNYAKPGDRIIDTHAGSFSIAIACHDLGFDLTAFEIDEEYYKAALKRYNDHKQQLKLF